MKPPADNAAEILSKLRKNYSQKELAGFLDYNPRQIARWESGKSAIPLAIIPALREIAGRNATKSENDEFTFIDLFAGIGGIRLGFESAGGKCIFTSEWDSYAQKTYTANFGEEHPIHGDITKVEAREIPDHDVLLAGFPCQPFSIAGVSKKNAMGRPHGFECTTQGTLFFDVARIIAEKRPKAFLLENVKNLLSHDKGNTFRVIRDTLEKELGYHISYRVINGKHFTPQHRERIIIVGFDSNTLFNWDNISLPELNDSSPRLKNILHSVNDPKSTIDDERYVDQNGLVHPKYILTDKLWTYLQAYAAKHKALGNGFGCSVVGPDNISRTLSARYYKDGSEILIERGKGNNPRRLTPRECARLMGYPDSYKIPVSDTRAYKQFGNSVVVPLMKHVAMLMKPYILQLKDEVNSADLFTAPQKVS
jgi:DNA (cytosine-5)-methyltransferase 1